MSTRTVHPPAAAMTARQHHMQRALVIAAETTIRHPDVYRRRRPVRHARPRAGWKI